MRGHFLFVLVLIFAAGFGCKEEPQSLSILQSERTERQLQSIYDLPYRGAPKPPAPHLGDLRELRSLLEREPSDDEVVLLKKMFSDNEALMAYAHRDSDGDGIFDYRVSSSMDGRFFEGDIDIDGDGVRNVMDANPYDPDIGFEDKNHNGIPDHVDWRLTRDDVKDPAELEKLTGIQQELFERYEILLVERTARFPLSTARAVYDAVTTVFASRFRDGRNFHTLKTVASEEYAWLYPDGGETCAMVFTPSQSMMVYAGSLKTHPLFQLALIVHEMAHSYQYHMDWDRKNEVNEFRRYYFEMKKFKKLVSRFEWIPTAQDLHPSVPFRLFASLDENKSDFLYQGESPKEWQDWMESLWLEHGEEYLDHHEVADRGIVGDYSLTDPLEWHADQLAAYVLARLEDVAREDMSPKEYDRMIKSMRALEKQTWPAFKHGNIRNGDVYKYMKRSFPMSKEKLLELTKRYFKDLDIL